ncbi:IS1380 family transposase [Brucella anthropi]|uniref:IS1380 family transposase n=1 Tax=Brucella anthropi TaxID=529 RepID=UPI000F68446F|nr:IS1380 family transposase [Brucella anthropi]KAB2764088.1 IS1380 family transposase [Brucella anthropi]RRY17158.1 IS1380 family transposase [Brucella anthropi]
MNDHTVPLSGLSPIDGKNVVARFDGGMLSSDGGLLALNEVEKRYRIAERLAGCIKDPRRSDQIVHGLSTMISFRIQMIAAGYEDGNDANRLRSDPVFKMAHNSLPSGRSLASQSTMCRLENLPGVRELLAMGQAMIDLYCASFRQVPKRIVLDIDDTFDAVHGCQQLRLFNAHHDEYGFQPIVVFDGDGRFVAAVLRPAKRPGGAEIRAHLRRLERMIRNNWPNTCILIRADSHYTSPLVIDWCRANDVDFILGVAPTTTLRKRFETSAKAGKVRRFTEFFDGAASWSRVERIIARMEAGAQGTDTRFIVTNLTGNRPKTLYEGVYCRRGMAENHIKSWKTHLAADRTSCTRATANQFRLFLHAGAYWLMWGLRAAMPKRSRFAVAQFDTLRLRLIKIAARVIEMKTQIRLHLPTSCPSQNILRLVLERIPKLAT